MISRHVLRGRRIMTPPARIAVHTPLPVLLEREGAEVVELPRLVAAPPPDEAALVRAASLVRTFDAVVLSGRLAAEAFFRRLSGPWPERGPVLVAVGGGAAAVARSAGVAALAPLEHTAEAVAGAVGDVAGGHVLLVRGGDASTELPRRLRAAGADVSEVVGFRLILDVDQEGMRRAFRPPPDAVALANPTAARVLRRAADQVELHLAELVAGVTVAAAGPATARAAAAAGCPATLVAPGRLAGLVAVLREHFSGEAGWTGRKA